MEQRATGLFLKVQGPTGVVVSMAAWMLDPVTCAGMTIGAPQVDRAALVELDQLLIDKSWNRRSPIDAAIVQEECNEDHQSPSRDTGFPTIEPVVRRKVLGGIELTGPEQGEAAAGTNPDESGAIGISFFTYLYRFPSPASNPSGSGVIHRPALAS